MLEMNNDHVFRNGSVYVVSYAIFYAHQDNVASDFHIYSYTRADLFPESVFSLFFDSLQKKKIFKKIVIEHNNKKIKPITVYYRGVEKFKIFFIYLV